jgi:hypothetical protein
MKFFPLLFALGFAAVPVHAQTSGPQLEAVLVRAYDAWREAMIRKDAAAWAAAITQYRQVVTRNEVVSDRKAFPAAVFEIPVAPPKLDGLRLLEAEAVGNTAHLVYFGAVDLGQDQDKQGKEVLLKLKFGLEGGAWKYDSNRFTGLSNASEAEMAALRAGKHPDFLETAEFTPPGSFPPVPPLCRVPDFKGGYKLQSFGYETTLSMNGYDFGPVSHALDQQVITGGLVRGENTITIRTKSVPPAEGQTPALKLRIYKLDTDDPDKPGVQVLDWSAPATGAPKEITLPFTVK